MPGISSASCLSTQITNAQPVVIDRIDVSEISANGDLTSAALDGPLTNGTISYSSISASPTITPPNYPRTFSISATGTNSDDEEVNITIALTYTQDCTIYPVLTQGMNFGWFVLVSEFV